MRFEYTFVQFLFYFTKRNSSAKLTTDGVTIELHRNQANEFPFFYSSVFLYLCVSLCAKNYASSDIVQRVCIFFSQDCVIDIYIIIYDFVHFIIDSYYYNVTFIIQSICRFVPFNISPRVSRIKIIIFVYFYLPGKKD